MSLISLASAVEPNHNRQMGDIREGSDMEPYMHFRGQIGVVHTRILQYYHSPAVGGIKRCSDRRGHIVSPRDNFLLIKLNLIFYCSA